MSIWRANLGSHNAWRIAFGVAILYGILWPFAQIAYWHFQNRATVKCGVFTLSIPFLWTSLDANKSNECSVGIYIAKHAPTVFGSKDEGSTLSIFHGQAHILDESKPSPLVTAFYRSSHSVMAFILTKDINHCIRGVLRNDSDRIVNVMCDLQNDYVLQFTGSEHALSQVQSMIKND